MIIFKWILPHSFPHTPEFYHLETAAVGVFLSAAEPPLHFDVLSSKKRNVWLLTLNEVNKKKNNSHATYTVKNKQTNKQANKQTHKINKPVNKQTVCAEVERLIRRPIRVSAPQLSGQLPVRSDAILQTPQFL